MIAYIGLFATAFLAATLWPLSSEALLLALQISGNYDNGILLLTAAAGNTLGAAVNWVVGRYLLAWQQRRAQAGRWVPVSTGRLAQAQRLFTRYGWPSLLFAWLPLVGDTLTVFAGLARMPVIPFLILVAIGKTARYAVLMGVLDSFS